MKKCGFALLLCLLLAFALVGCGDTSGDDIAQETPAPEVSPTPERVEIDEELAVPGAIYLTYYDYYFTVEVAAVYDEQSGESAQAYYAHVMLPNDVDLSALPVLISFNGTRLLLNGEAVALEPPVMLQLDFSGGAQHEITVECDNGQRVYTVWAELAE